MTNYYQQIKKQDYKGLKTREQIDLFNKEIDAKTKMYQKQYGFEISSKKGHETWNNESDAFKHTFMQALLSVRDGGTKSSLGGYAHELTNYTKNPKDETNMDLWNNSQGREIAKDFKNYLKQSNMKIEDFSEKQVEDMLAQLVVQRMKNNQLITNPRDPRRCEEFEWLKIDHLKQKTNEKEKNLFKRIFTREDIKQFSKDDLGANLDLIMAQDREMGTPTIQQANEYVAAGNFDYVHPDDGFTDFRQVSSGGTIWVEPYNRSDGTPVHGYYRRKTTSI